MWIIFCENGYVERASIGERAQHLWSLRRATHARKTTKGGEGVCRGTQGTPWIHHCIHPQSDPRRTVAGGIPWAD
jgi:hypothetical protein